MRDSVLIIAEAGVNHNGDIELAKKLIEVAAQAGGVGLEHAPHFDRACQ